ncbi:MAG TPA: hypothetical protein VJP77_03780 [Planctomycetota bacterium]|nr:hypothetical protein [Planctomycetota bacterium]
MGSLTRHARLAWVPALVVLGACSESEEARFGGAFGPFPEALRPALDEETRPTRVVFGVEYPHRSDAGAEVECRWFWRLAGGEWERWPFEGNVLRFGANAEGDGSRVGVDGYEVPDRSGALRGRLTLPPPAKLERTYAGAILIQTDEGSAVGALFGQGVQFEPARLGMQTRLDIQVVRLPAPFDAVPIEAILSGSNSWTHHYDGDELSVIRWIGDFEARGTPPAARLELMFELDPWPDR